ncbi:TPA: RyR domain-containing protein [Streptococcus suis]
MVFLFFSILLFVICNLSMLIKQKFEKVLLFWGLCASFWIIQLPSYNWMIGHNFFEVLINFSKELLLSILDVVKLFTLDLDFDAISMTYRGWQFEHLIIFWISFLYAIASCFSLAIVANYFNNWFLFVRMKYNHNAENHIFDGYIVKHLNLAKNIVHSNNSGRIIFASSNQEEITDIIDSRVVTKKDVLQLSRLISTRKCNRYYLLDKSSQSLEKALLLIEQYGVRETKDILYVQDLNGILESYLQAQSRDDECLKVRLVNQARSTIYNYFYQNKVFLEKMFLDTPHVVVVGESELARETIKLLSWLPQVMNKSINITVVYSSEEFVLQMKCDMPEVFKELSYEKKVDFNFSPLPTLSVGHIFENLNQLKNISGLFLLESDLLNLELADKVHQLLPRSSVLVFDVEDPILINIYKDKFKENILQYSIGFHNFDTELESKALGLHRKYETKFIERNFFNNQYNYFSSMARALGSRYLVGDIYREKRNKVPDFRMLELEHNRWSMYLKTEGWRCGIIRDMECKHHPLLVSFNSLSEKEKLKDLN